MNGRLTDMAESNYRIEDATQQQTLAITDIKGSIAGLTAQVQANYNVGDEVRTILAQSYIELQGINENTGAIVKPIQQMQKDIEVNHVLSSMGWRVIRVWEHEIRDNLPDTADMIIRIVNEVQAKP